MIINIDPYFVSPPFSTAETATPITPAARYASYIRNIGRNRSLAARESSFERAHGSLWEPGLLDRLTAPLTRYRE
jgi:hypothetical protein